MPKFRFDIEQGSDQWYFERMGRATASNFARIVTEVKGDWSDTGAKKYAREVAVQRLLDEETEPRIGHLPAIERGKLLEPDAAEAYSKKTKRMTTKVGIVVSDDGACSCSPDRIYGDPEGKTGSGLLVGIEIKVPGSPTHLQYLESGGPGRSYIWQVLGSMLICNFDEWDFFSYSPGLDGVLVRYQRNDYLSEMTKLAGHLAHFEEEVQRYVDLMKCSGYEPPVSKMKHRSVEEWEALQRADPDMWAI